MERSIPSQILDTLHLLLRIILGISILYGAISTGLLIALWIVIADAFSSKYGPVYEDTMFWPTVAILAGTAPSAIAGFVLVFKNRVASRDLRETGCAIINILSLVLFTKILYGAYSSGHSLFEQLVAITAALFYCVSAVMIIMLARRSHRAASVNPNPHLIK